MAEAFATQNGVLISNEEVGKFLVGRILLTESRTKALDRFSAVIPWVKGIVKAHHGLQGAALPASWVYFMRILAKIVVGSLPLGKQKNIIKKYYKQTAKKRVDAGPILSSLPSGLEVYVLYRLGFVLSEEEEDLLALHKKHLSESSAYRILFSFFFQICLHSLKLPRNGDPQEAKIDQPEYLRRQGPEHALVWTLLSTNPDLVDLCHNPKFMRYLLDLSSSKFLITPCLDQFVWYLYQYWRRRSAANNKIDPKLTKELFSLYLKARVPSTKQRKRLGGLSQEQWVTRAISLLGFYAVRGMSSKGDVIKEFKYLAKTSGTESFSSTPSKTGLILLLGVLADLGVKVGGVAAAAFLSVSGAEQKVQENSLTKEELRAYEAYRSVWKPPSAATGPAVTTAAASSSAPLDQKRSQQGVSSSESGACVHSSLVSPTCHFCPEPRRIAGVAFCSRKTREKAKHTGLALCRTCWESCTSTDSFGGIVCVEKVPDGLGGVTQCGNGMAGGYFKENQHPTFFPTWKPRVPPAPVLADGPQTDGGQGVPARRCERVVGGSSEPCRKPKQLSRKAKRAERKRKKRLRKTKAEAVAAEAKERKTRAPFFQLAQNQQLQISVSSETTVVFINRKQVTSTGGERPDVEHQSDESEPGQGDHAPQDSSSPQKALGSERAHVQDQSPEGEPGQGDRAPQDSSSPQKALESELLRQLYTY